MQKDLLDKVLCPACGSGDWRLDATTVETLDYEGGAREEVRTGTLTCSCGNVYPIEEFVLSFAQLFPPDLQREAAFWDRYYLWNVEHESLGFFDLRKGFTPFLVFGVPDAFPAADKIDRYDTHYAAAEHPLMRKGQTLLDMGVGLGWTSLHFARSGYTVTAFDPSLGPMQAAKRYAIEQRKQIEYICAAVGHLAFRDGSFDNAAAFHSLHHVPDLETNLLLLKKWLVPGGAFAVDEHICNSKLARALAAALHNWAANNVFPVYKSISDEELATLPSEPHSEREDASADLIVPLLHKLFTTHLESRRHVFFDHYPLLYYLWRGRDLDAYQKALEITNQFQELVLAVDPDGAEYITLVVENTPPTEREGASAVSHAAPATEPVSDTTQMRLEQLESEIAVLRARSDETDALRDQLLSATERSNMLQQALTEQSGWARSLEQAQLAKQREVDQLNRQLRRIEKGRVMRVLRLVRRK